MAGKLPNLIIIGAPKCGTTSLHLYLNLHPEIAMSRQKELRFFSRESEWKRGVDWYKSRFSSSTKISGEASPSYAFYPFSKEVPARIYNLIPDVKLIYIIRDPFKRTVSAYNHWFAEGKENRKIQQALFDPIENIYTFPSRYYLQLEQYLEFFPLYNILIITLEDLNKKRLQTLQGIFSFLSVDNSFTSPNFSRILNPTIGKRRKTRFGKFITRLSQSKFVKAFPAETRRTFEKMIYFPFSRKMDIQYLDRNLGQKLKDFFIDDVIKLKTLTHREFKDWDF
jgi:hypothetical protein